jgi:hypothetical protein
MEVADVVFEVVVEVALEIRRSRFIGFGSGCDGIELGNVGFGDDFDSVEFGRGSGSTVHRHLSCVHRTAGA